MKAIILAAGVGRRMEHLEDDKGSLPKCLLKLEDKTLLERHIINLNKAGVKKLHMVLGYRHEDIIKAAKLILKKEEFSDMSFSYTYNERYEEGSILSMFAAREQLESSPSILMDADVLYTEALLEKLLRSSNKNCFMLDIAAGASDEEMRLGADENKRVMVIQRGLPGGYPVIGEGVGFLKLDNESSKILMLETEKLIAENFLGDYENAINNFLKIEVVGYELVETPWLEIDFEEDVISAKQKVLPAVKEFESTH